MEQLIYLILPFGRRHSGHQTLHQQDLQHQKASDTPAGQGRLDSGDALTLLDVRTREEFASGHIPGAVCLPVEELSAPKPPQRSFRSKQARSWCTAGLAAAAPGPPGSWRTRATPP